MNATRPFSKLLLAASTALLFANAQGQGNCTNFSQFGGAVADPGGLVTTISTCSYESEYSVISSVIAAATYQFTLSSGGYITVHQDTFDGPIIGQGYSPVTVTAVTAGDLFPHWTVDDLCTTASGVCQVTTVQLFLNCLPPQATYTVTEDCLTNQFSISVNVATTGDGATVALGFSINGGTLVTQPGLGVGTYALGPFNYGELVSVVVGHEFDVACNITWNNIASPGNCPVIIDCDGAQLNETFCYPNNMNEDWHYQSSGGQPLAILFSSGTIESDFYDDLTIYDGPDATYPILWQHIGGTEDLSNVLAVSSGPDIYMAATSDGSVSCSSGSMLEWIWTVGCLDCEPTTTTFNIIPDCIHRTYQVAVDVDSLGSATAVNIYDRFSGDTLYNMPAGVTLIGPIPMDSTTKITVFNNDNSLCRKISNELIWTSDTCVVDTCGSANYSYCYVNSDTAWFSYRSTQGVPVTVRFLSGNLGPNDKVLFYNGTTVYSAVIFLGNNGGNMANFALNSTNVDNAITFRVMSDATGSCQGGQYEPLVWDVQCGAVGMDELADHGFHMYPNPTEGLLYVQMNEGASRPLSVVVLDLAGRQVMNVPTNNLSAGTNTIDLGNLQNGQYLVQVTTVDQVVAQRVQVMR
ncbi:MAG: T9SS type A sorting domain-containing protein [Flavobacteriales bacterium]|nr:T9SS type A sorting domain-containing protein [Flavobacteriales bacterium]